MANRKRNREDRLPPALVIWIGLVLMAALLINTGDQLERIGGVALAWLVIVGVLAHLIAD